MQRARARTEGAEGLEGGAQAAVELRRHGKHAVVKILLKELDKRHGPICVLIGVIHMKSAALAGLDVGRPDRHFLPQHGGHVLVAHLQRHGMRGEEGPNLDLHLLA